MELHESSETRPITHEEIEQEVNRWLHEDINTAHDVRREKYEILNHLGDGGFGSAYRVLNKDDQREYVLKIIRCDSDNQLQQTVLEVLTMKLVRSPFTVQFIEYFQHDQDIYLVMEFCPLGDLSQRLRSNQQQQRSPEQQQRWVVHLLSGLRDIHKEEFVHRDIKPQNVFLCEYDVLKLGDFGLAAAQQESSRTGGLVGTPGFISPEIISGGHYGKKSDVWSLGCTLYELFTRKSTYRDLYLQSGLVKARAIDRKDWEKWEKCVYSSTDQQGLVKRHSSKPYIITADIPTQNIQHQPPLLQFIVYWCLCVHEEDRATPEELLSIPQLKKMQTEVADELVVQKRLDKNRQLHGLKATHLPVQNNGMFSELTNILHRYAIVAANSAIWGWHVLTEPLVQHPSNNTNIASNPTSIQQPRDFLGGEAPLTSDISQEENGGNMNNINNINNNNNAQQLKESDHLRTLFFTDTELSDSVTLASSAALNSIWQVLAVCTLGQCSGTIISLIYKYWRVCFLTIFLPLTILKLQRKTEFDLKEDAITSLKERHPDLQLVVIQEDPAPNGIFQANKGEKVYMNSIQQENQHTLHQQHTLHLHNSQQHSKGSGNLTLDDSLLALEPGATPWVNSIMSKPLPAAGKPQQQAKGNTFFQRELDEVKTALTGNCGQVTDTMQGLWTRCGSSIDQMVSFLQSLTVPQQQLETIVYNVTFQKLCMFLGTYLWATELQTVMGNPGKATLTHFMMGMLLLVGISFSFWLIRNKLNHLAVTVGESIQHSSCIPCQNRANGHPHNANNAGLSGLSSSQMFPNSPMDKLNNTSLQKLSPPVYAMRSRARTTGNGQDAMFLPGNFNLLDSLALEGDFDDSPSIGPVLGSADKLTLEDSSTDEDEEEEPHRTSMLQDGVWAPSSILGSPGSIPQVERPEQDLASHNESEGGIKEDLLDAFLLNSDQCYYDARVTLKQFMQSTNVCCTCGMQTSKSSKLSSVEPTPSGKPLLNIAQAYRRRAIFLDLQLVERIHLNLRLIHNQAVYALAGTLVAVMLQLSISYQSTRDPLWDVLIYGNILRNKPSVSSDMVKWLGLQTSNDVITHQFGKTASDNIEKAVAEQLEVAPVPTITDTPTQIPLFIHLVIGFIIVCFFLFMHSVRINAAGTFLLQRLHKIARKKRVLDEYEILQNPDRVDLVNDSDANALRGVELLGRKLRSRCSGVITLDAILTFCAVAWQPVFTALLIIIGIHVLFVDCFFGLTLNTSVVAMTGRVLAALTFLTGGIVASEFTSKQTQVSRLLIKQFVLPCVITFFLFIFVNSFVYSLTIV